jgi:hypothetical protein
MARHVTAAPLWPKAEPDPRLNLGKLAQLSPSTTERIIGDMKADQSAYLQRIDQERFHTVPAARHSRKPTTVIGRNGHMHLGFPQAGPAVAQAAAPAPAQPEPVITPAVRPSEDVLADVHPLVRADVLRRCAGDLRRVEVRSPTQVIVHNRPCAA